ncbi:hypothetical protein H696_01685 [Fonticula alba]|uniref:RNB domain-containing protein n=1 Tax=Fonticula alba TaxID=691883 RepID=A0A058ZFN5_FONAL|nr:hypothetical protein H696_01685 [Fonticula alba]KCV72287.1 hypothetical protein H696_01685 [Fonticula alba]|eukprot:XP_009493865.1 hypothetical protein H696_01685 [Fonticula alba]
MILPRGIVALGRGALGGSRDRPVARAALAAQVVATRAASTTAHPGPGPAGPASVIGAFPRGGADTLSEGQLRFLRTPDTSSPVAPVKIGSFVRLARRILSQQARAARLDGQGHPAEAAAARQAAEHLRQTLITCPEAGPALRELQRSTSPYFRDVGPLAELRPWSVNRVNQLAEARHLAGTHYGLAVAALCSSLVSSPECILRELGLPTIPPDAILPEHLDLEDPAAGLVLSSLSPMPPAAVAHMHHIVENFPQMIDEACRLPFVVDRTHQTFMVVDDITTVDHDDAISVEYDAASGHTTIFAHIASPSLFIPFDSPLEQHLRARGSSIYLSKSRVPMLPPELTRLLSVLPIPGLAEDRALALTMAATIDQEGAILDTGLSVSVLRRSQGRRLTYNALDALLARESGVQDSGPEPALLPEEETLLQDLGSDATRVALLQDASRLLAATRTFRAHRQQATPTVSMGRVSLRRGEAELRVNGVLARQEALIPTRDGTTTSPADELVSESMILGNFVAATWARGQGIPFVFQSQRSQPGLLPAALREQVARSSAAGPLDLTFSERQLFFQAQDAGTYGLTPMRHSLLGLKTYAQVTSPLRRYMDALCHYQILSHLAGRSPLSEDELQPLMAHGSLKQRAARTASTTSERYYTAKFFDGWPRERPISARVMTVQPASDVSPPLDQLWLADPARNPALAPGGYATSPTYNVTATPASPQAPDYLVNMAAFRRPPRQMAEITAQLEPFGLEVTVLSGPADASTGPASLPKPGDTIQLYVSGVNLQSMRVSFVLAAPAAGAPGIASSLSSSP